MLSAVFGTIFIPQPEKKTEKEKFHFSIEGKKNESARTLVVWLLSTVGNKQIYHIATGRQNDVVSQEMWRKQTLKTF